MNMIVLGDNYLPMFNVSFIIQKIVITVKVNELQPVRCVLQHVTAIVITTSDITATDFTFYYTVI